MYTRYNRLSNPLSSRFENRLYRVYKHSTGCQTRLTTGCIMYTASCQTGCTTPFDNRLNEQWLFVKHGCQTRLYNRFDNRVERTAVHSSRLLNRVCQTSCTTRYDNRLNEQTAVKLGCTTGLTAVLNEQSVCSTRLSNRLYNPV